MLNPDLFLNENLFDKKVEQKPTRDGFGTGIVAVGRVEPNVVVLTADLGDSTRTDDFKKEFPNRFVECGVAEQNMAAIAAGLAESGKTPFISSYAVFSPGKNLETIRTTIAYNRANVIIAGHHSGVVTGADGATHQATEDIAITRALPGFKVICPCDAVEAHKSTIASVYLDSPVYLRFSREKTPIITTEKTPYDPNKMYEYWVSKNPVCTVFATGHMLYNALVAAKALSKEGIDVRVVNVANIKPLDKVSALEFVKDSGCAVTAEDHQIAGGLGSALAELFAQEHPIPIEFIGLKDTFAESGAPQDLLKKYGLDSASIKAAVKKVVSRKG